MADEPLRSSKHVLEPNERIAEVLFGLIMVLTYTGSLSVAQASRAQARTMLIGALGCNLAWGIVDGLMYVMGSLSEQGRGIRALRALRMATVSAEAYRVIAGALPPVVAATLGTAEYESVRHKLVQLPEPPSHPRLRKEDWLGALAVCSWVFLATFPVAIPFIFMHDIGWAMRLSNAIAFVMLFVTGYAFGRVSEYHPWVSGLAMVVVGTILAGMTIALGG